MVRKKPKATYEVRDKYGLLITRTYTREEANFVSKMNKGSIIKRYIKQIVD